MKEYVFVVPIENVSIGTAVQDIFALKSGAASPIEIHQIHLDAVATSAANLRMRLRTATATVTLGSGGSAVTPIKMDDAQPAAAATSHINDTSQASTSGAFTTMMGFNWDVVLPFDYLPAPEDRPKCKAGGEGFVLDLPATITATTVSGYIKWSEA